MTVYWDPKAARTTQVGTYDISATSTALRCTINGITLSGGTGTDRDEAIDNMVSVWNASTCIYFSVITASSDLSTATQLILTADTAGVPFVVLVEEDDSGWATVTATAADSVDADGPEFYDNTDNWSGGALPVANDDVVFRRSNVSCCYNLPVVAVALDTLSVEASYTGVIGLNPMGFATSADGKTVNNTVVEYRKDQLHHQIDETLTIGIGQGNGSGRIRIKSDDTTTTVIVYNTANSAIDAGRHACELEMLNTGTKKDYYVYDCPGGLLLENCAIDDLYLSAKNSSSFVTLAGTTTVDDDVYKNGVGTLYLRGNAPINGDLLIEKGKVYYDGSISMNDIYIYDGTLYPNTATLSISKIVMYGGTLDMTERGSTFTLTTFEAYDSIIPWGVKTNAAGIFAPGTTTISSAINWEFSA